LPPGPHRLIATLSGPENSGAAELATVDVFVEPCAIGAVLAEQAGPVAGDDGPAEHLSTRTGSATGLDAVYADFAAAIDARCAGQAGGCRPALTFWALMEPGKTEAAGYRYVVDTDAGSFMLGYSSPDGELATILPWTPAAAIQPGTATNRLAVLAQGDELRLFVNGEQVGEARDERRRWGRLGWSAEAPATGQAPELELRNLVVSAPGPPETLAAVLSSAGVTPLPPGNLLLADDLSNPNSGWQRQSSEPASRRVGYDGGEYMVAKLAGSGAPMVTRAERFGDFLVNGQEVGAAHDETLAEGTIAFGVGNVVGGAAEGRFSNFVVASLD